MRKLIHIGCLLMVMMLIGLKSLEAQTINYSVHANIIYHITKYIEWPAYERQGDFIIGFFGDSPLYDVLVSETANKKAGNQKIVIRRIHSLKDNLNCQILFITEDESSNLKKIVMLTESMPVLILTEEEGLAMKGSCINFVVVNDRLKMEFNKTNIEQRSLKVASELLGMGVVMEENKTIVKNK